MSRIPLFLILAEKQIRKLALNCVGGQSCRIDFINKKSRGGWFVESFSHRSNYKVKCCLNIVLGGDTAGAPGAGCTTIKGPLNENCSPALIHHYNANQALSPWQEAVPSHDAWKPLIRASQLVGIKSPWIMASFRDCLFLKPLKDFNILQGWTKVSFNKDQNLSMVIFLNKF